MRKLLIVLFIAAAHAWVPPSSQGGSPGAAPMSTPMEKGRRRAVVVGIQGNLRYARADAEAFAEALVERCGFAPRNVVLLTDCPIFRDKHRKNCASLANLQERIGQMARRAGENDMLIVFFSCHGSQHGGRGYLQPAGAGDGVDSLLPVSWLRRTLEGSAARQRLLILDACFSGPQLDADPRRKRLAHLSGAEFLTLASSGANEPSWEDPARRHGAFTAALLEGLAAGAADRLERGNNDGVITARELFFFAEAWIRDYCRRSGNTMTPVLMGSTRGPVALVRYRNRPEMADSGDVRPRRDKRQAVAVAAEAAVDTPSPTAEPPAGRGAAPLTLLADRHDDAHGWMKAIGKRRAKQ